jgi:hypothetical protein
MVFEKSSEEGRLQLPTTEPPANTKNLCKNTANSSYKICPPIAIASITARTKTAKHKRSFNSKDTLVVVGDNSVCGYYFLNKKCLITNKHSEKPRQFSALIWGNGKSQVTGIESGFKSQRARFNFSSRKIEDLLNVLNESHLP